MLWLNVATDRGARNRARQTAVDGASTGHERVFTIGTGSYVIASVKNLGGAPARQGRAGQSRDIEFQCGFTVRTRDRTETRPRQTIAYVRYWKGGTCLVYAQLESERSLVETQIAKHSLSACQAFAYMPGRTGYRR